MDKMKVLILKEKQDTAKSCIDILNEIADKMEDDFPEITKYKVIEEIHMI